MDLPDTITIQINDQTGQPVPDIIVQLTVKSGNRNAYQILSPKTGSDGHAQITKPDFIGQFEDHWEMGLMDYNGTVESASPDVQVSLFDPSWHIANPEACLAWPLFKNEQGHWASRQAQYEHLVSCANPHYLATPKPVNLETNNKISLTVSKP
ncbi:hypothetical protein BI364_02265 [Acidihalobacter yilgarnensis]|uniref:Invasin domain-containing protein n=1 Tax=Acidihalobacter yilgarnensis TaxID=2819280 RepID=A0A1D8IKK0_9GAMM|nr:hypothetical protein [Acidihalobacter yilgarnensis]AOU96988.1 hypothetical protein BI364_02265 [Acidihalobacter yilgarnensis]